MLCVFAGVRCYVHTLEQVAIDTCLSLGLNGARRIFPNPGVWIADEDKGGESKVCAVGIRCSNSITKHGIALNCNNDLVGFFLPKCFDVVFIIMPIAFQSWFSHIVACGLSGKGVTTLSEQLKRDVTVSEVSSHFVASFKDRFGCQLVMQQSGLRFSP